MAKAPECICDGKRERGREFRGAFVSEAGFFSAAEDYMREEGTPSRVFFFAGVLVIFAGIVWSIKNLVKCALCNVYPLLSNHAFCLSSKALKNASCISLSRDAGNVVYF